MSEIVENITFRRMQYARICVKVEGEESIVSGYVHM